MNYGNCFQKEERQAANRTATQGDPRIVADGDILITTRTVIKRVRMRFASEINGECALS